jgi:hypothetical protein
MNMNMNMNMNMKRKCLTLINLLLLINIELWSQSILNISYSSKIPNKISDKYTPSNNLKLNGFLEFRVMTNIEKRLLKIDSAILLSGFKKRPGSQTWIGEHVGKFLHSASNAYLYSQDVRLKQLMDEMVKKYISYQLEDGYIGTYLPKDYWTEWDVWAHKYCIIGLLQYYSITGDNKALICSQRAADLICNTFGNAPGKRDIILSGHHVGMAAGSILEPMVDLYRFTGDKKYLDFAEYILKAWEQPNGPKILSALEKTGRVTDVGNAKAYEMMSCFVGIAKYAKLTGNEKYINLLEKAWQDIRLNRLYISGTSSSFEHFKEDDVLPSKDDDHMGEGCVTTTWIQFNEQLLQITGKLIYEEEIERAIYNHLTAAENPVTGCVSYYTALDGVKPYKCDQGYSCCLSSIPRGISIIPRFVFGKVNNIFSVMMYSAGNVIDSVTCTDGTKAQITLTGISDFPISGRVSYQLMISTNKTFSIQFRIPSWSKNFTYSDSKGMNNGIAGDWLTISKTWDKLNSFEITFYMPIQQIDGGISNPSSIAIKRGPQVFAYDESLNKGITIKELQFYEFSDNQTQFPTFSTDWTWKQILTAYTKPDKSQKITLVPYSEAGQNQSEVKVWFPIKNYFNK